MIISEKQLFQLIAIATGYQNTLGILIAQQLATGDPKSLIKNISSLLLEIHNQQSDVLKEIE